MFYMFFKNSLFVFYVAILSPISMNAAMIEKKWGTSKPAKARNPKNVCLRASLQRKEKNDAIQATATDRSSRKRPSEESVVIAQRPTKKQKIDPADGKDFTDGQDAMEILARIKWKNDLTPQEQAEKIKKQQFMATGSPRNLPAVTAGEQNSAEKWRLECGHKNCFFTTASRSKLQNHYTAHIAKESGEKVYPCRRKGCHHLALTEEREEEHFKRRHTKECIYCNSCEEGVGVRYTGVDLPAHTARYHNGNTIPFNKRFPGSISSDQLLRDCAKLRALNAAVAKNNMTIEIN